MDDQANQPEPVRPAAPETAANRRGPLPETEPRTGADRHPDLLTVSQAYAYLIAEGLPRSKKTIRKWCRLNHVEWKEIAVPGGAKWLITRSSLDARLAEERLIDASLTQETAANPSEPVQTETGAHPSVPVRDDALVAVLKEQLAHERVARRAAEARSRELIDKYHEISLASARMGIEIGKGMQEQARARRLAAHGDTGSGNSVENAGRSRIREVEDTGKPPTDRAIETAGDHRAGDNPDPGWQDDPV